MNVNDGEIIPISKKDVEIRAAVETKGTTIAVICVSRVELTDVATQYFGMINSKGLYDSILVMMNGRKSVFLKNEGEVFKISREDVGFWANVKVKSRTIQCSVNRAETSTVDTTYYGRVKIEGEDYNFKIVMPNSLQVKEAAVQFNSVD